MEVRLASIADAAATREIYNHAVTTSTVTFDLVARTLEEQQAWLEARAGGYAAIVAEDEREVVGFAALSPYRDRPAYSTTVENSVYVAEHARRAGVGKALLEELVDLAKRHGFHAIIARIVGGHDASIALHASVGFTVVCEEKEVGRKFGRWLDVVVMERLLTDD